MRKTLFILILGLFNLTLVFAQEKKVSGRVTASDQPDGIPGLSVQVKGSTVGTITDINGKYEITVPSNNSILMFSSIGYNAVEETVGNRSILNVILTLDNQILNEVIVTAYGTANKGNFTGSASTLKADKIANRPINNIANIIEGQAVGAVTTSANGQPGSTPEIIIRGVGSVNSSNAPLYVVDGVPYDGNISNLNPDDVQDMTILKDASSSALYGSRAANGVIMITTKTGQKGKPTFNISVKQGVSNRALPEYERVNADQYYPLVWESLRNSQLTGGKTSEVANQYASDNLISTLGYNIYNVDDKAVVGLDGKLNPNASSNFQGLNWFDELQRKGNRSEVNLSYGGRNETTDYYASFGYLNEKGFIIKSNLERYTGRLNVNTSPTKWLKTGINLSTTMSDGNNANYSGSSSYVNPFFTARAIGPIYPVFAQNPKTGGFVLDENGDRIFDLGNLRELGLPSRGSGAFPGRHVVQETLLNEDLTDRDVISARAYTEIFFLKNFSLKTNIATDVTSLLNSSYDNQIVGDGAPAGRTERINRRYNTYTFNQLLNYSNTFNSKHFVDVLVGHENYDYKFSRYRIFKQDQILAGNIEPDNFVTTNATAGRIDKYRIESYFSRLNYAFDERYVFSASYRTDGSSKFYKDVRWGDFYSLGLAWNISNESFISSSKINLLKLRTSYGQVGNDRIQNSDAEDLYYPWQALYELGHNNASAAGIYQKSLAAQDLVWESNNSFDIGVDYAFFNRIQGTLEYFQRESSNLLFEVPLSLTTGLESRTQNVGTMSNSGIEFSITGNVIQKKDFSWNVSLNASTFKNKFKKLPFEEKIVGTKKYVVGRSIYEYWLRDWYGVDPETGEGLYRAENTSLDLEDVRIIGSDTLTNKIANAKYHFAGSAIPDFTGGLNNIFRYKNLSLSFLLSFSVGGKIYDATYASLMEADPDGGALHVDALNRWQKPGDITDVPRMDVTTAAQSNGSSDRWLIDRSYLNFRSINLSYTIPASILNRFKMKQAHVFIAGENLGWLSKRKGMFVSQRFNGTTSNTYTPAKSFTAGISVNL